MQLPHSEELNIGYLSRLFDNNSFIERLEHVIKPVYESAQTLGFKEWIYDGSNNI